jgi:hypothetical protein
VSGKERKREKSILGNCDRFVKSNMCSKVRKFFFDNEAPTINKVSAVVNSDDQLPDFKRTTFYKLLKDVGFQFLKRSGCNVIIDRDDIVLWRRNYLRIVQQHGTEK